MTGFILIIQVFEIYFNIQLNPSQSIYYSVLSFFVKSLVSKLNRQVRIKLTSYVSLLQTDICRTFDCLY